MAASDEALMALLGGSVTGADVGALDAFRQGIAAESPYRTAAAPILGAQFNMGTWNPTQRFGVSAAQSFIGSLLGEIAKKDEADQLAKVTAVLPAMYRDPKSVSTPKGVDLAPFELFKQKIIAQKDIGDALQASKIAEEKRAVVNAGEKKFLEEFKGVQGKQQGYGLTGSADPDSPIEKQISSLRTSFNALDEVKNYKYIRNLSTQLSSVLKNPDAVSDQSLAKIAVQIIEPGLSANKDETQALRESPSIPATWKGSISKSISGGTELGTEIRSGLLNLMKSGFDARQRTYQETADLYKQETDRLNQPFERISLMKPTTFTGYTGVDLEGLNVADLADKAGFAAKAKSLGLDLQQANAAWDKLSKGK